MSTTEESGTVPATHPTESSIVQHPPGDDEGARDKRSGNEQEVALVEDSEATVPHEKCCVACAQLYHWYP